MWCSLHEPSSGRPIHMVSAGCTLFLLQSSPLRKQSSSFEEAGPTAGLRSSFALHRSLNQEASSERPWASGASQLAWG